MSMMLLMRHRVLETKSRAVSFSDIACLGLREGGVTRRWSA